MMLNNIKLIFHVNRSLTMAQAKAISYGPGPESHQGFQMAYFQAKNPNMGKFRRVLRWQVLVYFAAIWYILWLFGIFCGYLVGILFPFWYIVPIEIWQH
jgi:hypothetical protein